MLNSAGAFSLLPPTAETQNCESTRIKTLFCRTPQGKVKGCPRADHQAERARLTTSNNQVGSWVSNIHEIYTNRNEKRRTELTEKTIKNINILIETEHHKRFASETHLRLFLCNLKKFNFYSLVIKNRL